MIELTRFQADCIIQSLVVTRSHEATEDARETRKKIAEKLEVAFPGIIRDNFAEILLRS